MRRYTIEINGVSYAVDVQELGGNRFQARVSDAEFEVRLADDTPLAGATITPLQPAQAQTAIVAAPVEAPHPPQAHNGTHLAPPGQYTVVAPLPGLIESILVKPGERVSRGQALLVLEAMKMRNTIQAAQGGLVSEVLAQAGQTVRHGDPLLFIDRDVS